MNSDRRFGNFLQFLGFPSTARPRNASLFSAELSQYLTGRIDDSALDRRANSQSFPAKGADAAPSDQLTDLERELSLRAGLDRRLGILLEDSKQLCAQLEAYVASQGQRDSSSKSRNYDVRVG